MKNKCIFLGRMTLKKYLFLLAFSVGGFLSATVEIHAATPEVVDVFFLSGQSNASGRVTTGYVADPRDAQVDYYYYTDGPPPQIQTSNNVFTTLAPLSTGYYGAEISLGRRLVDLNYNPAIIKVSKGGTSLTGQWYSREDIAWKGVMWSIWKAEVSQALATLTAQGKIVRIQGFFWMQGETDTDDAHLLPAPNDYESVYADFTGDVVDHLNSLGHDASDLIFATGLIRDYDYDNDGSLLDTQTVRDAQVSVMDSLGDSRGGWFDTSDLNTLTPTNLHYDQAGVTTLGERFANKFHEIHSVPEPASAILLGMGIWTFLFRRNRVDPAE